MRICAFVCLAVLAAPSILWTQVRSETELRAEIEEHAIDPCLRTILGNVGLLKKMSVEEYKRFLVSSGNKENDLMMASALPLVSDLDKLGDRMEVYYKARFTCIEGAMKTLSAGVAPSSTVKNQRLKIANQQPKPSWTSQFNQVSPVTRKLIKRSDDTILKVSLGGGSGTWHLIIEVARNTATHYAKTVGDNALYIMEHKFAEFGPADFEVEVQRDGTPWDSKTYVSTIWRGVKRKGDRRIQWEQVIGEDRAIRERKGRALKAGETFDSVYDSIFSPPSSK